MGDRHACEAEPRTSGNRRAQGLRGSDLSRDQHSHGSASGHGRYSLPFSPGALAWANGEGSGMNDEIEDRLARLTPRGAPPELRHHVLAAVAGELARFPPGLQTREG